MTIFITILLILLFALAWIIFVPVFLVIDTQKQRYTVFQQGTMKLVFHPDQSPSWEFRVVGFRVTISGKSKKTEKPKIKNEKKKTRFKRSVESWMFLIHSALQSFKVRKLTADFDTDDVVLNAKLVPVLLLINRERVHIATNFEGKQILNLEIEGRLNKLLWTFILFLAKK